MEDWMKATLSLLLLLSVLGGCTAPMLPSTSAPTTGPRNSPVEFYVASPPPTEDGFGHHFFSRIVPTFVEGNFSRFYVDSGNGYVLVNPFANETRWIEVPAVQLSWERAVVLPSTSFLGYDNYITARTISAGWMEESEGKVTFAEDGTPSRNAQQVTGVVRSGDESFLMTSSYQTTAPAALQYLYRRTGTTWTELRHPMPFSPLLGASGLAANSTRLFVCLANADGSVLVDTLDHDGNVLATAIAEPSGQVGSGCWAGSARQGVPAFFWREPANLLDLGVGRVTTWNGQSWDTQTIADNFNPDSMGGFGEDRFIIGNPANDANAISLYHSHGNAEWKTCAIPIETGFDRARPGEAELFSTADGAWLAFVRGNGSQAFDDVVTLRLAPNGPCTS
jgi:hypothetical protein